MEPPRRDESSGQQRKGSGPKLRPAFQGRRRISREILVARVWFRLCLWHLLSRRGWGRFEGWIIQKPFATLTYVGLVSCFFFPNWPAAAAAHCNPHSKK